MTMGTTSPLPLPDAPPFQVRVLGPDCEPLSDTDLRRLFPGAALTASRLERIAGWSRVVVACGPRAIAVATYQRHDTELRVPDLALDAELPCSVSDAANALLDALELACLAAGCRRIVILPPAASAAALLRRRGYLAVDQGCAGSWVEKTLA
jgi:hypothetical protein